MAEGQARTHVRGVEPQVEDIRRGVGVAQELSLVLPRPQLREQGTELKRLNVHLDAVRPQLRLNDLRRLARQVRGRDERRKGQWPAVLVEHASLPRLPA